MNEKEIVWLEDVNQYEYVRQGSVWTPTRSKKPRVEHTADFKTLVGYAVLDKDARSSAGRFEIRYFYVRTYDPYPGPGKPCEAVDPKQVKID